MCVCVCVCVCVCIKTYSGIFTPKGYREKMPFFATDVNSIQSPETGLPGYLCGVSPHFCDLEP